MKKSLTILLLLPLPPKIARVELKLETLTPAIKDWRITGYLKDKWKALGQRPEELTIKIAKLVVTVWARATPTIKHISLATTLPVKPNLVVCSQR